MFGTWTTQDLTDELSPFNPKAKVVIYNHSEDREYGFVVQEMDNGDVRLVVE
jgi:hypothetical protein